MFCLRRRPVCIRSLPWRNWTRNSIITLFWWEQASNPRSYCAHLFLVLCARAGPE
jgi:hypothetical protein